MGWRPSIEATWTIDPPVPCARMASAAAAVSRWTAVRLVSIISAHCSSVISVKWTTGWMPALLTSPSMRPWSTAAWTTRSAASGSVRSAVTDTTGSPPASTR